MKLIEVTEAAWNVEFALMSDSLTDGELIDIGEQLVRDTEGRSKTQSSIGGGIGVQGSYLSRSDAFEAKANIKRKARRILRGPNPPWRLYDMAVLVVYDGRVTKFIVR